MSPDFRAALGFAVGTRGCAGGGGGLLTRCARQCPPRCRACPAGAPASRAVHSVPVDALGQFLPRGGGGQSRPWAWRALPPRPGLRPLQGSALSLGRSCSCAFQVSTFRCVEHTRLSLFLLLKNGVLGVTGM